MKNINFHRFLIFMGMTIFTFNTNAQTTTKTTTVYHYKIPEFYYDNEEVKKYVANIRELITNKGTLVTRLQGGEPEKSHGLQEKYPLLP